ncbi:peptide/nickel transport system permease protein [Parafrankia irregularis]|uniref:Peptide/nickel transport system permease protein n=1 Tax=Parafrankia irregularis TaxID=795642 RepID=A0A0S4QY81_9ACTN|nr:MULTISPECIES: ABC transporter permease [Parafrankia]MBE3200663.1 ABC transporter permease [Parafrankia sp. CH37]CUU60493.1 peptide/nickel transport system permease protein [Parafrankia irregularis]
MLRYLVRRLPSAVLVLFLASVLIFAIIRLIPGDPATSLAGSDASPEAVAAIRHDLGLDQSVPSQYLSWIGNVLTFDFGQSYSVGGEITSLVADGFGNTVILTLSALLLAILIAIVVGPVWATTRNRWLESAITVVNTISVALPTFVSGVLLVLLFTVIFPVLPSAGVPPDGMFARLDITLQYLVLPALCLALPVSAVLSRFLAETLRTQLRQPYILTATALGVPRRRLLLRYAMRNALPTTVTVIGLQAGSLLGGAVLVEAIFAWPGIGQLIEQAIGRRDYPVVQVLLLLSVFVFVVIQLLTDLVHALLDPRVRIGGAQ